jgi:hypothetical protein
VDERAQVDDLVNSLLISTTNELNLDSSPLTDNSTPTENISNPISPVQIQTKKELMIEKRRKLTLSKCLGSIHNLPIVKETYDKVLLLLTLLSLLSFIFTYGLLFF